MSEDDSKCVLCSLEEESFYHLFGRCDVYMRIWRRVYMWLGVSNDISIEEFVEFFFYCHNIKCVSKRYIIGMVWLATVWSLSLFRNAIIFKDANFSFLECMSDIVYSAWG